MKQASKKEDTKQRILDEALWLFSQSGYDAVSVERIASAVGTVQAFQKQAGDI